MRGTHYAECVDCDATFADRAEMSAHTTATLTSTGASTGVTATSHSVQVVNPTPEERAASRVRSVISRAVGDACERAFEDIDRAIRRGDLTEEQAGAELRLWFPDFAEGWDEWRAEADL